MEQVSLHVVCMSQFIGHDSCAVSSSVHIIYQCSAILKNKQNIKSFMGQGMWARVYIYVLSFIVSSKK